MYYLCKTTTECLGLNRLNCKNGEISLLPTHYKCNMCRDNFHINETYQLSCDHVFCKKCLFEYFSLSMQNHKRFMNFKCPSYECKHFVN